MEMGPKRWLFVHETLFHCRSISFIKYLCEVAWKAFSERNEEGRKVGRKDKNHKLPIDRTEQKAKVEWVRKTKLLNKEITQ